MKRPFRSAMPPLDNIRLPVGLALILLAAWAFQLAVRDPATPADVGPIGGGRGRGAPPPVLPPARLDPVILARTIFAPAVAPATATSPGAAGPLDGHAIVGAVRIGRYAYAVVRTPGGRIARVVVGSRVGGWRLRGLTATEALLDRGSETMAVPFGAAGGVPVQPGPDPTGANS